MKFMGFLISFLLRILKPQTTWCMWMSTAAWVAFVCTCHHGSLSFIKWLLDCSAGNQLHVKVPHKQQAYLVWDHGILIYRDDNRHTCFRENLTNQLWVAGWNEGHFDFRSIAADEIVQPRLIKLINYSCAILFKLKIKLITIRIEVSMAREMQYLWVLGQNCFERLEVYGLLDNVHLLFNLLQHIYKATIFWVEIKPFVKRHELWLLWIILILDLLQQGHAIEVSKIEALGFIKHSWYCMLPHFGDVLLCLLQHQLILYKCIGIFNTKSFALNLFCFDFRLCFGLHYWSLFFL